MNLVLHELFNRSDIILNYMLVGVNVCKVLDLLGFELLLFFSCSFLLESSLLSEGVESNRSVAVGRILRQGLIF